MPPMFYSTHSFAMALGVIGARVIRLSCFGYDDQAHPDEVYGSGRNLWDNPFANQSALCQLSDGAVARVNELRCIGLDYSNVVRLKVYGEHASFEEMAGGPNRWASQYVFSHRLGGCERVDDKVTCTPKDAGEPGAFFGLAPAHDSSSLPDSFRGLPNGHFGSHQFLVIDFMTALVEREVPVNGIEDAIRYTLPGFIAHESARRGGETLPVPQP
ncbi:MAG: hypothetical protein ACFB21_11295 [Opitutales bacterium]